ncbi:MAG: hypothetical protein J7M40_20220 [Planctomycetes bacterium]|nr:hypothetical protein [Planctomycetota bacterium]
METTYKLISAKDFIKTHPTGEPDLEQSKKILIELAAIAEPPADYEILLDARDAYGTLTLFDMYELVTELGRHRSAFRNKIAVLSRPDHQFDKARFLELCARNRGFQVGAFTDFQETIEWLQTCVEIGKTVSEKSE